MTSLNKRNGNYTIRYRDLKGRRRYTLPKGTTRREAEEIARQIQCQIDLYGYWKKGVGG